jgi:hypothetical protein
MVIDPRFSHVHGRNVVSRPTMNDRVFVNLLYARIPITQDISPCVNKLLGIEDTIGDESVDSIKQRGEPAF